MILESSSSGRDHEPCLTDYVDGLFEPGSGAPCEMTVREVASALEAYANANGQQMIESSNLAVLASSAVRALGREDLAVEAFIKGTGAVYPRTLACAEGAPVWVINTELLFPDMRCCTELAFFAVLDRLVTSMVHLWDAQSGRGALGIRKLRSVATLFASVKKGHDGVDHWTSNIMDSVSSRLEQCSQGRGWTSLPVVLMLD